jgi:hypothetical protein
MDEDHETWWDWEVWREGRYPQDAVDDPDCAAGFIWQCCKKRGNEEGCKVTKHKALANRVVDNGAEVLFVASKKRKAEVVDL